MPRKCSQQPEGDPEDAAATVPLRIVEQLADLTAQTIPEQLERALLRLVIDVADDATVSLLRLDDSRHIRFELRSQGGRLEVRTSGFSPRDDVRKALLDTECAATGHLTLAADDGESTLHCMRKDSQAPVYLRVLRDTPAPEAAHELIEALIRVYRNHCELLRDAQTDQLTGLSNRKTFDASIERIYAELEGRGDELLNDRRQPRDQEHFLAILDIDHFKRVNDTYGHLYGDEVLLLIARLLKSSLRTNDLVFRFGGEEFVLILQCTDRSACRRVLDRLRETIAIFDFPRVGQVTVSIGAAQLSSRVFHVTHMDHADQALYYSKHNGRNRTTFFDDLVERGEASPSELAADDEDVMFFE